MQNKKIIGLPKKTFFIALGALILVAAILTGLFAFASKGKTLSPEEAKEKTETYINENLMPSGSKVKISDVTEFEGELYKMKIDLGGGQIIDSYVTKDGKTFFPQSMEITGNNSNENNSETAAPNTKGSSGEISKKSDKPVVELFIMSYCPYGTQIQKGITPVVEALGKNIDFKLKFVSYAMHGEKELKENLVQYCIQKKEPKKLVSYLNCFLKDGDSASCLAENKLDVDSCVKSADKEFAVTKNFEEKIGWQGSYPPFNTDKSDNEKYDVQGSPTLIINGEEASSSRDPQSLLETICSAFNEKPEACSTQLSSAAPTPGFGTGTTSNGGDVQCN